MERSAALAAEAHTVLAARQAELTDKEAALVSAAEVSLTERSAALAAEAHHAGGARSGTGGEGRGGACREGGGARG